MTLRGRLTLGLPFAALAAGAVLVRGPGPQRARAARARWLEPPAELRLARVEAPPPELPWAPGLGARRACPSRRRRSSSRRRAPTGCRRSSRPGARLWESDRRAARAPRPRDTAACRVHARTRRSPSACSSVLEQSHVDLGHVIVMDPATDELLVYASTDVERFPPTPTYPAASLIKVVTAAAALERAPGAARAAVPLRRQPVPAHRVAREPAAARHRGVAHEGARHLEQPVLRAARRARGRARRALLDVIRRFGILEAPGAGARRRLGVDPGQDPLRARPARLRARRLPHHAAPRRAPRAASLADGQLDHPRWIARVVDGSGRELPLPEPASRAACSRRRSPRRCAR